MRRTVAAALALAAVALAAAPASYAAAGPFAGVGRWLTYPDGRVFIPHGLNTVVSKPPYYNARLGLDDARLLANEGFTAMRLLFLPSKLEERVGELDGAYLDRFVAQVRLLDRFGITTLLGLDQLRYAEACGGEGFPQWAVLAPCAAGGTFDPAAAWAQFWANAPAPDGIGLQEHFVGWWRAVAARFSPLRSLLGYDLLNEPTTTTPEALGALIARTAAAVRATGDRHLAFIEPDDPGWPRFGGVLPAELGFGGHVYCETTLAKAYRRVLPTEQEVDACVRANAAMLATQIAYAGGSASPLLVGEFGASDELREQRELVDAMARAFVPWIGYAYSAHLDTTGTPTQAILRDDDKPASQANAKQAKLGVLAVPYPMAIAGTPLSWRFDRRTRVVRFTYSTRRVGGGRFSGTPPTIVFVPRRHYRTGYTVRAVGARVVSPPTAPWLRLVSSRGVARVRVTISPRQGSRTLTPLDAGQCGFDLGPCGAPR